MAEYIRGKLNRDKWYRSTRFYLKFVAKRELELKNYNYKNNKSGDPVIPPLGYNHAYEHNGTHI